MELLERYLNQIGRYLPKKDRTDTLNELKSLILDEFDMNDEPGLSDEERMIKVLKAYGMPKDVAMRYRKEEPLVSKEYQPLFFMILKILSVTLPAALVLANTIEYFNNTEEITVMGILLDTAYLIPDILSALLTALAMVFIVFVVLSRYVKPKFEFEEMEFDPRLLPAIPTDVMKVSVVEQIIGLLGGVLFLYLFNLQPGLIAVYYEDVREPLLNSNFERILPLINISVFISMGTYIFHLYKRRKTVASTTVEFLGGIFSGIILILLATSDVFNPIIIDGYDLDIIPTLFRVGMWVGAIGSFIGHTVTYVKVMFRKQD